MRITVKQHHRQFLSTIANQMGTNESTACDYLFWELRRTGFSFSSSMRIDGSQAIPYVPEVVSNFVDDHYEEIQQDPELQRIIAIGLEEF
jgi:hypothetical protein